MGTWRTDRGFACELQKQSSRSKPEMVYIGFGTKGLDELGFVPSDGGCAAVLAGDGERPHLGGEPGAGPERGESGPAGGGRRRRARPPDPRRRSAALRPPRCPERAR